MVDGLIFDRVAKGDKCCFIEAYQESYPTNKIWIKCLPGVDAKIFADRLFDIGISAILPEDVSSYFRAAGQHIKAMERRGDTIRAFTRVGKNDRYFIFPDEVLPEPDFPYAITIDGEDEGQSTKLNKAGTLRGWQKLERLIEGNDRLIMMLALQPAAFLNNFTPHNIVPEFVFFGAGGTGKSASARDISSFWGWSKDPIEAANFGYGGSFNSTINAAELANSLYNDTCRFIDDVSVADGPMGSNATAMSLLFRLSTGKPKARMGQKSHTTNVAILCTSNVSGQQLWRSMGQKSGKQHADRCIDIGVSSLTNTMVEDLHGRNNLTDFFAATNAIARANHGVAARHYVKGMVDWYKRDPDDLQQFISEREQYFINKAREELEISPGEHGRLLSVFARVYAAAATAQKVGAFNLARKLFREAIRNCLADHLDRNAEFYAELEQNAPAQLSPPSALRHWFSSRKDECVRLSATKIAKTKYDPSKLYVQPRPDGDYVLFPNSMLETAVGGKVRANQLKRDLDKNGHIAFTGSGNDKKYSVKVKIGAKSPQVIAIKLSALT